VILRATVQGRPLILRLHPTEVFVPNLMSWFSAAQMRVRPGDAFLDVGTGTGLHAILAAKLGARRVYATDINPVALRLARENARRNGVDRLCHFMLGSLTEPLFARGTRVDAMVYNAPHFPGNLVDRRLPKRLISSVSGGAAGGDLNARFLREAPRVLAPRGRIYNPVVAWADPATSRRAIAAAGYQAASLANVHIPVWGRGNNTRDWLLTRPGRHVFAFGYAPSRDSAASIQELTLDAPALLAAARKSRVEIRFQATSR
jgi:release factor glutamine methyltransferase